MAEEIRPAGIYRTRRVERTSSEGREETDEWFRKKLAQLAEGEQEESRHGRPLPPTSQTARAEAQPPAAPAADSSVGRNLDVST